MATNPYHGPKISINQLTLYRKSSAAARRTILRQQKNPPAYMVTYYERASSAISAALLTYPDISSLTEEIARLDAEISVLQDGVREKTRLLKNREALHLAQQTIPTLSFPDCTMAEFTGRDAHVDVSGVRVTVRPEILLSNASGKTGAIKLFFSADDEKRLTVQDGKFIAATVRKYCQEVRREDVDKRLVLVFDVFGNRVHAAPVHDTLINQDIEANCREIALVWPHV